MGKKVLNSKKIVIVDSGVNRNIKEFNQNIIGGINFEYKDEKIIINNNYDDDNGHGTYCASIIQQVSNNTEMYIIKVLDKEARTHSRALIEVLKYIKNINIRVINLSVATISMEYKNELENVCNELCEQGKIIVCSLKNRDGTSYPAAFRSVIGVQSIETSKDEEYWYNSSKNIQCVANGVPVFVPTLDNQYQMFGGNSKATAWFSGKILDIIEKQPHITWNELNRLLENNAAKNIWNEADTFVSRNLRFKEIGLKINNCCKEKLNKIEKILVNHLNLNKDDTKLLYKYEMPNEKIFFKHRDLYNIMKNMELEFNINIEYTKISLNTFNSIYSLYNFVIKRIGNDI
jgi:hypothetical protein